MTFVSDVCRKGLLPVVALLSSCLFLSSTAFAQVSPEVHAKHHPEQEKGGRKKGGGLMGEKKGGMGEPKPKEMQPSLMELPDLPLEERAKIQQAAPANRPSSATSSCITP